MALALAARNKAVANRAAQEKARQRRHGAALTDDELQKEVETQLAFINHCRKTLDEVSRGGKGEGV